MFALRTRLQCFKWVGMLTVFLGLIVVGLADILSKGGASTDTSNMILGALTVLEMPVKGL